MKQFDISDVLTISTGNLVSRRGIEGVYDIMGYIIGDSGITTIGLAMMAQRAKELILKQHPELASVRFTVYLNDLSPEEVKTEIGKWLDEQSSRFGETLPIAEPDDPIVVSLESQIRYVKHLNPDAKVAVVEEGK